MEPKSSNFETLEDWNLRINLIPNPVRVKQEPLKLNSSEKVTMKILDDTNEDAKRIITPLEVRIKSAL